MIKKCQLCKKEIKKDYCYNGTHYWHDKCKEIDTNNKLKRYLNNKD